MVSIGIDIGYSTLKFVVLNKKKEIVHDNYIFHHGNINELLVRELKYITKELEIESAFVGIVGDVGSSLEKYEVNSIASLVEGSLKVENRVKSIIHIGAQSSRFINNFSNSSKVNTKFYMNTSCSAGTGSFLEEQVSRLGINIHDYSELVKSASNPPRIAGRCSVFSKTDMIHHQQEGTSIDEILLGLSYALVRNFKSNVVQKNNLEKPVIVTGGVALNQGVIRAIKETFELSDTDIIVNKNAAIVSAIGTALIACDKKLMVSINSLLEIIVKPERFELNTTYYKPLLSFGIKDSIDKHVCAPLKEGCNNVHVGIDIGSTSTNVVVINKLNEVLAYRYLRTKGDPKQAVQDGLNSIKEEFAERIKIVSLATTGSGRNMIGELYEADLVVNEITAQAKGAVELDEEIDTIFEIGGQDSKYISIKEARVVDFEMNKICAAGTGSFIEEQAIKLDVAIHQYEEIALKGLNPIELGNRCTVFIEGNISKAISEGQSKENIIAGLSYSVVNNYLNRVVANKKIGKKIFLQGGVAYNQAVVNAFRAVLNKEVIVPRFFSVTGAYGAAILGKEEVTKKHESIIKSDIRDIEEEILEMYLHGYEKNIDITKETIGIPRVLFLHKLFPMFNAYFKELGFNVVLSDETDEEIIRLSQEYSLDETCYPIKLINGHVKSLINSKVDYIFLPSLYTMKHENSKVREDYACVYMQTVPQVISSVMDLEKSKIKLLSPALSFKFGKKYMMKTLIDLGKQIGKNTIQTTIALTKGMKALKKFETGVEKLGSDVINNLEEDEKVFVIITRAYGVSDKELNMQIPKTLKSMGYKVLTLSNLPAHNYDISKDYPNMYWPFGQHILSGAKIIKESKNLYAIYLTNHGCGPDSIISHYFKEEMRDKPFLHIEVDEHSSAVGVKTRLEAFIDSIENHIPEEHQQNNISSIITEKECDKLYIPFLYPFSHLTKELMSLNGRNVEHLLETNDLSLKFGKVFSLSKETVTMTALLGDVFTSVKENNATVFLPQTEGSEVNGQYSAILEQKIREYNRKINVESPFIEDLLEDDNFGLDYIYVLILGDVVMTLSKENRSIYLSKALKLIRSNSLNISKIKEFTKEVYEELKKEKYKKTIFLLGDKDIIYNPFLNNYQVNKLEEKFRISYMPLSEMMYFKWNDDNKKSLSCNLKEMERLIYEVANELKEFSSFDDNLSEMVMKSNQILPLYSGGNGRYRMIKQFRCSEDINGVMVLNSMYENTGTIIKILKDTRQNEIKYPLIELYFDGSKHSNNDEKIQNFIYYI